MFETDEIERQLLENPGLAYRNLKRRFILDSVFLCIAGAIASIGFLGIFISAIAGLWVCFDFLVHMKVLGEEKGIGRGKRTLIFWGWFAVCVAVGVGAKTLVALIFLPG